MMTLPAIRLAILLSAATMTPATPLVRDQVDVVELNHVYDGDGRLVLRQLIFWNWRPAQQRFHVVAWRLWRPQEPTPVRDWQRGGYALLWYDGAVLRRVRTRQFRETWTQFDPEIEDRRLLPQRYRTGLTRAEPPTTLPGETSPRR